MTDSIIGNPKGKAMSRWLPASIVAVLAVVVGTAAFFMSRPGDRVVESIKPSDVQRPVMTSGSQSAVGWSVADDPAVAVREAYDMALSRMDEGAVPNFAYALYSVGFDRDAVVRVTRELLPPTVRLHGLTSSNGVMTNEGLHVGKVGSFAILLSSAPDVSYGTAGIEMSAYETPQGVGRALAEAVLADAGKDSSDRPDVLIFNGTPRRNDDMEVLDGIAEVFGKDVPVIGGTAGNDTNDPTWAQFTKDKTMINGAVMTAIWTERRMGWEFESQFRLTDKGGTVTKVDGRVVKEIDGRPALDVYAEWLGPEMLDKLSTLEFKEMAKYTATNPLARIIRGDSGEVGYYTLHPVPTADNLKDRFLPLGGPIPEGSEIKLFSGSWQTILNRAESIPNKALIRGGFPAEDALFGIMTLCRGASSTLPADELSKLPLLTNVVMGGRPFIGVISRGEQGPIPGIRNVNANLVESMVIIGR